MKSIILSIFLMTTLVGIAQTNLNDYKYVIIPKKFDAFKKENQHQTSTLIKHLFSKKGFKTVYDDDLPAELSANRCLGLVAYLLNNSSMFTTKTVIELKDCNNKQVFKTQEGRSKNKEFKAAYSEAINQAFNSFSSIDYTYETKLEAKQEEPITLSFENDVKEVEEKINDEQSEEPIVNDVTIIEQVATKEVQYYKDRTPVESNFKKADSVEEPKLSEQVVVKEEENVQSIESDIPNSNIKDTGSLNKTITGILYAQEIPNGFQLVDSTPKIQLKIFKSSMPNVYIAKSDNKDGVVYTSDGKWFFEHYEGDQVIQEELDIKF